MSTIERLVDIALYSALIVTVVIFANDNIDLRKENRDLTARIASPKQFEMSGNTYRCYLFPKVKVEDL
jgi:hypothetical protein